VFGDSLSRSILLPGIVRIRLHSDAALHNDAARDAARLSESDFVDLFSFSDRGLDLPQDFTSDAFPSNDAGIAAIASSAQSAI
jgi:hypothetical protein